MFQNFALLLTLPRSCFRTPHEHLMAVPLRRFCKGSCGKKVPECKEKSKEDRKPSCQQDRKPKKCKKTPSPVPSFSECRKDSNVPKPSRECDCLKTPSQCEVLQADKSDKSK